MEATTSKRKNVTRNLKPPLYPVRVFICLTEDINDAMSDYEKYFGKQDRDKWTLACALANFDRGVFALFIPFNASTKTIAHELWHLTNYILRQVGIVADHDNDEPGAYLNGWLTERVYRLLGTVQL